MIKRSVRSCDWKSSQWKFLLGKGSIYAWNTIQFQSVHQPIVTRYRPPQHGLICYSMDSICASLQSTLRSRSSRMCKLTRTPSWRLVTRTSWKEVRCINWTQTRWQKGKRKSSQWRAEMKNALCVPIITIKIWYVFLRWSKKGSQCRGLKCSTSTRTRFETDAGMCYRKKKGRVSRTTMTLTATKDEWSLLSSNKNEPDGDGNGRKFVDARDQVRCRDFPAENATGKLFSSSADSVLTNH